MRLFVVRHAEAAPGEPDELRPLTAAGRDAPPIAGTVEEVCEQLRAYEAVGVERVMLQHFAHEDVEMVAVLGDVAESLR